MTSHIVAVIGGTGLYQMEGLENVRDEIIETPFGAPSSPIVRGTLHGVEMLFLARHGRNHSILPSEINYRANIWALKSLGASWCISVSAVGSLAEELSPGTLVVPDQIIDRTSLRKNTFFGDGIVAHVSVADPFCPVLREALISANGIVAKKSGFGTASKGTYVCMEGPAFSTRAESHMYRSWGAQIIGMTNLPEAKLAREAEIAYGTLALVTDYDCWKEDGDDVDVSKVIEILHRNSANAKLVVAEAVSILREKEPSPMAHDALKHALITRLSEAPSESVSRLKPLLARYL